MANTTLTLNFIFYQPYLFCPNSIDDRYYHFYLERGKPQEALLQDSKYISVYLDRRTASPQCLGNIINTITDVIDWLPPLLESVFQCVIWINCHDCNDMISKISIFNSLAGDTILVVGQWALSLSIIQYLPVWKNYEIVKDFIIRAGGGAT